MFTALRLIISKLWSFYEVDENSMICKVSVKSVECAEQLESRLTELREGVQEFDEFMKVLG